MATRKEMHDWDIANIGEELHKPPCLAAHVSWYAASNTCSYRGQARLQAVSEGARYKGIKKPGSYASSSRVPIWHEAHHMVPNGELNDALGSVGDAFRRLVRAGLLAEGYNLNDQLNMIILPMLPKDSKALNLPRHRQTHLFNHAAYSKHVKSRLNKIMEPMKAKAKKCNLEQYQNIKRQIENISKTIYPQIKKAGPGLLEEIKFKVKSEM